MGEIIMSATVEHFNVEDAPNGPGFYYIVNGLAPNGPYGSEDLAVAEVTKLLEASAAAFIKQTLIPE